jgi:hypothetical protein
LKRGSPNPSYPQFLGPHPPPPQTKFYLDDLAICAKGEKKKGEIDGDK